MHFRHLLAPWRSTREQLMQSRLKYLNNLPGHLAALAGANNSGLTGLGYLKPRLDRSGYQLRVAARDYWIEQ